MRKRVLDCTHEVILVCRSWLVQTTTLGTVSISWMTRPGKSNKFLTR